MITYISVGVLTLLFLIIFWKDMLEYYKLKEFFSIFATVLFCLFLGMCCGGILTLVPHLWYRSFSQYSEKIKEDVYSYNIKSIKTNDQKVGSFFLGCGSIGSEEYYVYFKQYKDGGIKKGILRASIAMIYEKDESPRVEFTEVTRKVPWWLRYGFDATDISKGREGDYRIIVPKGTIIEKFEIR